MLGAVLSRASALDAVEKAALAEPALAIAHALDYPAYDCFYVALAQAREAIVVTDDRTLLKCVARTPWQSFVTPLSR